MFGAKYALDNSIWIFPNHFNDSSKFTMLNIAKWAYYYSKNLADFFSEKLIGNKYICRIKAFVVTAGLVIYKLHVIPMDVTAYQTLYNICGIAYVAYATYCLFTGNNESISNAIKDYCHAFKIYICTSGKMLISNVRFLFSN